MNFEVYSKPNCEFCTRAKNLLDKNSLEYSVVDIAEGSIEDQVLSRERLIDRVVNATGNLPKTMPQIFCDDEYVGGYTELEAFLKDH
jgi:glutaredoxin